jgi:hypothetical protein
LRRRLINLVTGASLLLALAAALPWLRSYSGSDHFSRGRVIRSDSHSITSRYQSITWTGGSLRFALAEGTSFLTQPTMKSANPDAPAFWSYVRLGRGRVGWDRPRVRSVWNRLGFYAIRNDFMSSFADHREKGFVLPAWLAVAAFAVLPALRAFQMIRARRRFAEGCCPSCGYDLRATPDRCPECGLVIARPTGPSPRGSA